jgi:hypothetical protein
MFQFPGLPSPGLCVQPRDTRALPRVGFPIRKSRDRRLVSTYPGLIAAAHVLLRLLAPRHPPCALILLIGEEHQIQRCHYGVFKVRTGRCPPYERKPPRGRSLKTQQRGYVEVDVLLGELGIRTAVAIETGRAPTGARAPDSLERR